MNNKLLLFIFLFKGFLTFSQTPKNKDTIFFNHVFDSSSKFFNQINFKKASNYFSLKNWDSTLVYTQKQINISNRSKEIKNFCYLYRGVSLSKKKVYNEALNQLSLISSDFIFSNRVSIYKAALSIELKNYDDAILFLKKVEHIKENQLSYIYKDEILNDLGISYLFLKDYSKAEKYFKQSYENEKDTSSLIDKYINIANLYYNRYQDDIAIPYFQKAYKLSKKLKVKKNKVSLSELNEKKNQIYQQKRVTARNMSIVEENRKDFQKALVYRKEMEKWKDSLNDQNKIYEVAKIEKEFAVKEKQKEVDFLQVENELKETQRNNVIYIASVLLLLLFVSIYFYREKVKRNKIIAEQKENLDALNNTKDKLFSIVSHDLRSSVNALKTSNTVLLDNLQSKNINALEGLLQKNSAIVNGAYGLLDNLLNWALLQTNQGYFHIESLRLFIIVEHVAYNYKPLLFEKELSFENSISKKALIYADQESLKIILRNLLDNAIKFSKQNGALKVYSEEAGDFWNLIVEDTGLGMSEATRQELLKDSALLHKKEHEEVLGTGLGLSLVKSMIHKNHGKFNIKSELGKGTKMIVSLPKTQPNG